MTAEMYHEYFKEYQNDLDLFIDKRAYTVYAYDEEKVNRYIKRQADLKRKVFAIIFGDEMVGEVIIKNIEERCHHGNLHEKSEIQGQRLWNKSRTVGDCVCVSGIGHSGLVRGYHLIQYTEPARPGKGRIPVPEGRRKLPLLLH